MTLYGKQLTQIAKIIEALDTISADDETDFTPYAQFVPIFIEDDVIGYLTDEVGGAYQYWEASPEWRAWWAAKPR